MKRKHPQCWVETWASAHSPLQKLIFDNSDEPTDSA